MQPHTLNSAVRDNKGIALFLVLWVLVLLSVIVGEFCYAMRTEATVARNYKEQREAYYIALAGLNRAVAELMKKEASAGKKVVRADEGISTLLQSVLRQAPLGGEERAGEKAGIDQSQWRVNVDIPPQAFGAGEFQVRIGNESGKVDINRANESMLRMLLNSFDLNEKEKDIIVDSILDWRDEDDLHRVNGAENEYYRSLKPPYECKNADFDTIEELLLVRGVTEDLFYGGLREMVTVTGEGRSAVKPGQKAVRQVRTAGDAKININAASPRMLKALPGMTDEAVEGILAFRKEADLTTLNDLVAIVGAEAASRLQPFATFQPSPYYTVKTVGRVEGAPVRQGIEVLIQLDKGEKTGYRILEWRDGLRQEPHRGSRVKAGS